MSSPAEQVAAAHQSMLRHRHIYPDQVCPGCSGYGVKAYGSTAMWRGGIGGSAITPGVCDKCWGSGNKHRPWPSWRKYEAMEHELQQLREERNAGAQ